MLARPVINSSVATCTYHNTLFKLRYLPCCAQNPRFIRVHRWRVRCRALRPAIHRCCSSHRPRSTDYAPKRTPTHAGNTHRSGGERLPNTSDRGQPGPRDARTPYARALVTLILLFKLPTWLFSSAAWPTLSSNRHESKLGRDDTRPSPRG